MITKVALKEGFWYAYAGRTKIEGDTTRSGVIARARLRGYDIARKIVFTGIVCTCGRVATVGTLCPHCGGWERVRADLFQLPLI